MRRLNGYVPYGGTFEIHYVDGHTVTVSSGLMIADHSIAYTPPSQAADLVIVPWQQIRFIRQLPQ